MTQPIFQTTCSKSPPRIEHLALPIMSACFHS